MRKKNKNTSNSKPKNVGSLLGNVNNPSFPETVEGIPFKNRLKPRSINQKEYIRTAAENIVTFCQGVPGSGKTHIAIGMALEYLLSGKVEKIVITRPVVEAGEKLGFLPGTAEEKLNPYLLPLFDEIEYFLQIQHFHRLKSFRKLEIVPLGLMRGRSFHNAFIVADECQNASYDQLKMLLTRIGMDSKMILTGDVEQSDLQIQQQGGFISIIDKLQNTNNIGFSVLETSDIVRNSIIADIIYKI